MKLVMTTCAALGLLALTGFGTAATAGPGGIEAAKAGEVTILSHGRHWDCQVGPRGWWHRNSVLTGLPVLCVRPRG
jgi:hypothetical protein